MTAMVAVIPCGTSAMEWPRRAAVVTTLALVLLTLSGTLAYQWGGRSVSAFAPPSASAPGLAPRAAGVAPQHRGAPAAAAARRSPMNVASRSSSSLVPPPGPLIRYRGVAPEAAYVPLPGSPNAEV